MRILLIMKRFGLLVLFSISLIFLTFTFPVQAGCNPYPQYSSPIGGGGCAAYIKPDGACGSVECGPCNSQEDTILEYYSCNPGSSCVNGSSCVPNPPSCALTGPTVAYTTIPVTYTGTASIGAIGTLTGMGIYRNLPPNPTWTTLCSSASTCTTNTTFPSVGTYYVNCNAYASYPDSTTQMGYVTKTVTVSTDTTAPTINSVTASPVSPSKTNSVSFTANVTDAQSGLNTVQVSINPDPNSGTTGAWTVLGTCSANGIQSAYNCAQTWTPTTEGRHAVRVVAVDRSGNSTTNSSTNAITYFLVDKTLPTFTSLTVSPDSGSYTSQVVITATVNDTSTTTNYPSGTSDVRIYVNDDTNGSYGGVWRQLTSCTSSPQGPSGRTSTCTWYANGSQRAPLGPYSGTHYIAVNAWDYAGNLRSWGLNSAGTIWDPNNAAPFGHTTYVLASSYTCN